MTQTKQERNKALVLEAFDTLFNKRDYVAAERYWSPTYIQHSAHIAPGREGLFNLVRSLPPTLKYEPGMILADGDLVIVHGRFSGFGAPVNWIAADILRIEDGVFVEHWDVIQDEATREQSKSGRPMFGNSFPLSALTGPEEAKMEKTTLLDAYLSGPEILRAAVAGISRDQLVSRPVAGKWSVLEVVCHLADTDANIAHRIKRVLSEERPVFDRVKPELMLATLAYHDRDLEEELGAFDLTRRQIGRILRASPPQAWERTGIAGDRGDRTVNQMINGAVEHLTHHLRFIMEKRRALSID